MVRRGFTLLETIATVVLLVTISVAVTTVYMQVRNQGYERLGRARLETVLQAEYALMANGARFSDNPDDLRALTAGTPVTGNASVDADTVSIALGEDGSLGLAVSLPSGGCVLAAVSSPTDGLVTTYPTTPSGDTVICHGALALAAGVARLAPTP